MATTVGKFDTDAGWAVGYPKVSVIKDLVTSNTTVGWIHMADTWSILTIVVYAQFRMFVQGANIASNVLAYVIGEILSFDIPNALVLNAQDADDRVKSDTRLNFPLIAAGRSLQQMQAAANDLPQALRGNIDNTTDFSASAAQANAIVQNAQDAWACCWIVAKCKYQNSCISHVVTIYVCFLATIAKMGNVTDGFLDKIANRVQLEINVPLAPLWWDVEVIQSVWVLIGGYVNENNMGEMCTHWIGDAHNPGVIPNHALYMRILVDQIKGEGLTALSTIKKALTTCPTFDWDIVAAMFPAEFDAIDAAFVAIGDNLYYGYKKNNHATKSTLYKNVAWVAKELLIRKGGNASLIRYKGWTRNPERSNQLNMMIDNYINNIPMPHPAAIGAGGAVVQTCTQHAYAATGVTIN